MQAQVLEPERAPATAEARWLLKVWGRPSHPRVAAAEGATESHASLGRAGRRSTPPRPGRGDSPPAILKRRLARTDSRPRAGACGMSASPVWVVFPPGASGMSARAACGLFPQSVWGMSARPACGLFPPSAWGMSGGLAFGLSLGGVYPQTLVEQSPVSGG